MFAHGQNYTGAGYIHAGEKSLIPYENGDTHNLEMEVVAFH